jgi:hypothetical protein
MNPIIQEITENRGGNYCHALEVCDVYELENVCDVIYNDFADKYSIDKIIDFFNTIQLYCLEEANETEVYNFSFSEYLNTL